MQPDDLSEVDYCDIFACRSWQEKFRLLTTWGKLITLKNDLRNEEYFIQGCETNSWLANVGSEESPLFVFDSESKIINGLFVFVAAQVQAQSKENPALLDLSSSFEKAKLEKQLTPSRSKGLKTIIKRMQELSSIQVS